MAKAARSSEKVPKSRAALTPEAREKQLIALAIDVAEEQMRNGTASSQVISHFLKLGSTRAQIEKELLEKQRDLAAAKAEAIESSAKMEDLYLKAAKAIHRCTPYLERAMYFLIPPAPIPRREATPSETSSSPMNSYGSISFSAL